jgi:hypothetical protein
MEDELRKASRNGDLLKVRQLLDQGMDPNVEVDAVPFCLIIV